MDSPCKTVLRIQPTREIEDTLFQRRFFCLGLASSRRRAATSRGRVHRLADQSNHRSAKSNRGGETGLSHAHSFGLRGSAAEVTRAKTRGSSCGRHDEMAQPHLPLRRLCVLLPRGSPRGSGQSDASRPTSKIPAIHGGGLYRIRVSSTSDLQFRYCTRGRRSAFVQTGSTPRSFLPNVEAPSIEASFNLKVRVL